MSSVSPLFGTRPEARADPPAFTPPPADEWREVRARKEAAAVQARRARRSGVLDTDFGPMRYRAGEDYIVARGHDRPVVRRDIFERTYRRRIDGLFEKRTDVVYRHVVADAPVLVQTLEGPERAEPGDWILQGVAGEFWPVSKAMAETLYTPAQG